MNALITPFEYLVDATEEGNCVGSARNVTELSLRILARLLRGASLGKSHGTPFPEGNSVLKQCHVRMSHQLHQAAQTNEKIDLIHEYRL